MFISLPSTPVSLNKVKSKDEAQNAKQVKILHPVPFQKRPSSVWARCRPMSSTSLISSISIIVVVLAPMSLFAPFAVSVLFGASGAGRFATRPPTLARRSRIRSSWPSIGPSRVMRLRCVGTLSEDMLSNKETIPRRRRTRAAVSARCSARACSCATCSVYRRDSSGSVSASEESSQADGRPNMAADDAVR